jgi:hypothetical protein
MRELTKSTLSAGLAMPLFGIQTMMNVFRRSPTGGPNPAEESLDAVTQALVDQTGNTLRETFQASDKVQRELIDLSFRLMNLGVMSPGNGTSTLADATRQAAGRLRQWMGGMGGARGTDCGCSGSASRSPDAGPTGAPAGASLSGWGPMPDQS